MELVAHPSFVASADMLFPAGHCVQCALYTLVDLAYSNTGLNVLLYVGSIVPLIYGPHLRWTRLFTILGGTVRLSLSYMVLVLYHGMLHSLKLVSESSSTSQLVAIGTVRYI